MEMCGAEYTPDVVTDEPKTHGVVASGEAPTTGGRGGQICGTRGYPYADESKVGADLHGDTVAIGFCAPLRMCFFEVCVVDTDKSDYYGKQPQKNPVSSQAAKRVKISLGLT